MDEGVPETSVDFSRIGDKPSTDQKEVGPPVDKEPSLIDGISRKNDEIFNILRNKVNGMPDIPILKPWLQEKVGYGEAARALWLGKDPDHPDQRIEGKVDRVKKFVELEMRALGHQVEAVVDVLKITHPEGSGQALQILDNKGEAVVNSLPGFFSWAVKKLGGESGEEHSDVVSALKKMQEMYNDLTSVPEVKEAMINTVNKWTALQGNTTEVKDL